MGSDWHGDDASARMHGRTESTVYGFARATNPRSDDKIYAALTNATGALTSAYPHPRGLQSILFESPRVELVHTRVCRVGWSDLGRHLGRLVYTLFCPLLNTNAYTLFTTLSYISTLLAKVYCIS